MTRTKQYRTNRQDMQRKEERAEFDDYRENIGDVQRVLSGIAAMAFLATGLARRNWSGAVLAMVGGGLVYRALSGYCPAVEALGIEGGDNNQAGRANDTNRLGRRKVHTDQATKIQRAIEINRPPHVIYRYWRSLENLPHIMNHLESVQVSNERLSHWTVKTLPGTPALEWDAEIINDVENRRIGWKSVQGADVANTGSVEFKPTDGGKGTWLTVTLQYEPPGGRLGETLAKWLGADPDMKLGVDLQRFKEQMETGVVLYAADSERSRQRQGGHSV
jgi:uncharacterized membrane protein